jgi:hypothetical protein
MVDDEASLCKRYQSCAQEARQKRHADYRAVKFRKEIGYKVVELDQRSS